MTAPTDLTVIDTHALVWYLENSPKLSSNARLAFDAIDQGLSIGLVPTIVLAELMHISERGRIILDFAQAIARLQDGRNFGIVSLDLGILIRMRNLTMLELHDRIIVATALSFGAGLISQDETVRNSGIVECIW